MLVISNGYVEPYIEHMCYILTMLGDRAPPLVGHQKGLSERTYPLDTSNITPPLRTRCQQTFADPALGCPGAPRCESTAGVCARVQATRPTSCARRWWSDTATTSSTPRRRR
jgi:hypothetical protein